MEKINWTDRVRNEEVLHRIKEKRNILHTITRKRADWIGHMLGRNCLLKHIIEGKVERGIEVTGRQGGTYKPLVDDHKETRRYWKLIEEALDCILWKTHFGRGYGPVANGLQNE